MFHLTTTHQFERTLGKFINARPQLKKKVTQVIIDLEKDPFQPHLHLHPLKGKLAGLFGISVSYHYRLTLTLSISEKEIILIDIGTHDEVYR